MTDQHDPAGTGVDAEVARPGGVSYLRVPARDVAQSAEFFQAVFGWQLRGDPHSPSFSDGTGHVIGHWHTDLPAAGEPESCPTSMSTTLTTFCTARPSTAPRSSPRPTPKETSGSPPSKTRPATPSASGSKDHADRISHPERLRDGADLLRPHQDRRSWSSQIPNRLR
jgi:hypothetical protein